MSKKFLTSIMVTIVGLFAVAGIYLQSSPTLSDMTLENVEALASWEDPGDVDDPSRWVTCHRSVCGDPPTPYSPIQEYVYCDDCQPIRGYWADYGGSCSPN